MKRNLKIENLNSVIGSKISWLNILLVFSMFASVLLRYLFESNPVWLTELTIYIHSLLFLTAAGYTLFHNEHVRVDLFYEKFSNKAKSAINIIGAVVLLMPLCVIIIHQSWGFVVDSWSIFEKSREYGGIPAVFVLKSFVVFFVLFLLIESIAMIYRYILQVTK